MATYFIGSKFTTRKSNVTGIIKDIVENANGTYRVLLDVDGVDRWTTV